MRAGGAAGKTPTCMRCTTAASASAAASLFAACSSSSFASRVACRSRMVSSWKGGRRTGGCCGQGMAPEGAHSFAYQWECVCWWVCEHAHAHARSVGTGMRVMLVRAPACVLAYARAHACNKQVSINAFSASAADPQPVAALTPCSCSHPQLTCFRMVRSWFLMALLSALYSASSLDSLRT